MPNSPMNIVLAADLKMAEQVLTTIKSICYHNKNICFYLLNKEYSTEWFTQLNQYLNKIHCEIKDIKIAGEIRHNKTKHLSHISEVTWYRLLVGRLIEDKALYLDCDIVVTGDLREVYQTDLQDNYVAAVHDAILNNVTHYYHEFPDIKPYFNAGVLLINAAKWRENNIDAQAFNMSNTYNFIYADQDLLNILFLKKWLPLSSTYNYQTGADVNAQMHGLPKDIQKTTDSIPKIIHFTTKFKPWLADVSCSFRQQYWFYYCLDWSAIIARHK
ncbi:glycosyltransferase family 8 protein [Moraxella marmotae]|uniref:glycosyltransferase family 8 protein n=1 Tax=Moraxella marmotae TaxID=3344520 RepID=UPI0035F3CD89